MVFWFGFGITELPFVNRSYNRYYYIKPSKT
jgi:hypothetical protein